jgi:hypothetical protein
MNSSLKTLLNKTSENGFLYAGVHGFRPLYILLFGANSNAVATATTSSPECKGTLSTTSYAPDTLAGQKYRVEKTDSLLPVDWQTVSNNIFGTGSPIEIPLWNTPGTQGSYRVLILAP